ncbi:MAG TPA: ATP-binding cassette domain-containing protein, partial [Chloroflexota bacterium]|nr:ATP-binding cassette domain-containing protein [Chloroflexota bacterium]
FRPGHLVGVERRAGERPDPAFGPVGVTLRDASFTYPGAARPAFQGLTLDIPPGAFVAVTGPVGAGKSALARGLAGGYGPDVGEILLAGQPATAIAPRVVGYAPQDGYLFSGSVRENVLLAPDADAPPDQRELDRLIELAGMTEDVEALPRGVETQIGELGMRISGGQRQRLGLARAAAARRPGIPGLLILDDPFSAVDVDTEARIVAHLSAAFGPDAPAGQRTTFVLFSHRLASFPGADLVVVLNRGRIVEQGRHADLLRAGGLYARIYDAQQRVEHGASAEVSPR